MLAGYNAEEKRVWRFYVNKNYSIKDINQQNHEIVKKRKEMQVQSISFLCF